jgi:DNA-binding transcriptional regulator YdaS (Cro superfamily)
MKLREYVEREGVGTISRLSRVTGISYTTLLAAINGRAATRYDTAKKISEATGGAVSISDICDRSG